MASVREHLKTSIAQNQGKKERLQHQVRQLKRDLDRYGNYTYTVDEQVIEKEPNNPGQYTTNCITCNMTCHENCPFNNEQRKRCPAMDKNGYCTVCPQNCHWNMHENQPYVYVIRINKVTKTADDIKSKFEDTEYKIKLRNRELDQVNSEIDADKRKLSQLKLDEKHLLQVSKRLPGETERTELGLNLGIPDYEISTAKYNNRDQFTMANYDMLKRWFVTTSNRNDAWEELEKALLKCKLNQIVAEVLTLKES